MCILNQLVEVICENRSAVAFADGKYKSDYRYYQMIQGQMIAVQPVAELISDQQYSAFLLCC